MDFSDRIRELRKSTGMTRKDFCARFGIPYRTMSDWETGLRRAPEYVIRLLNYYISMEGLNKKENGT